METTKSTLCAYRLSELPTLSVENLLLVLFPLIRQLYIPSMKNLILRVAVLIGGSEIYFIIPFPHLLKYWGSRAADETTGNSLSGLPLLTAPLIWRQAGVEYTPWSHDWITYIDQK